MLKFRLKSTNNLQLQINRLKNDLKPELFKGSQKIYVIKFLKTNYRLFVGFFVLALIESLLLISLPVILKYLVENDYNFFRLNSLIVDIVLISVLVVALIATSYGLIRVDQTIGFNLINQLKRDWLMHFFQTASSEESKLSDGTLIAKFVYHTQLLKMALDKVVLEGSRGIIFYLVILVAAFLFSGSTFLWLLLGFPLLCVICVIFYFIGSYYISREQTLNTRILKALVQQMGNLHQITALGLAQERFDMISQLLEQDTYFRKRREIWVKFSDRLIFALIILISALLYVVKDFLPIMSWNNWSEGAMGIILAGFFTKIVMQASHAGLFGQALKTGLIITIPEFVNSQNKLDRKVKIDFDQTILIRGKKVKLSKFGNSIAQMNLEIPPKSKILVQSEGPLGKSTLAKFIAGLNTIESLNVKIGKKLIFAINWSQENHLRQYISMSHIFQEAVAEYILAKPSAEISSEDINNLFLKLKKYPEFEFIFVYNNFLSKRFNSFQSSESEFVLLQVAQAVLAQPRLISIDHTVYDSPNLLVKKALDILKEACPNTTFVYFSGIIDTSNNEKFDHIYRLTKNEFKKN